MSGKDREEDNSTERDGTKTGMRPRAETKDKRKGKRSRNRER